MQRNIFPHQSRGSKVKELSVEVGTSNFVYRAVATGAARPVANHLNSVGVLAGKAGQHHGGDASLFSFIAVGDAELAPNNMFFSRNAAADAVGNEASQDVKLVLFGRVKKRVGRFGIACKDRVRKRNSAGRVEAGTRQPVAQQEMVHQRRQLVDGGRNRVSWPGRAR